MSLTIKTAKKIIDYGVWVLFFVFFTYSFLFFITKDAVPGDWLFGTKLAMEKVLIAGSSVINRQVDAEIEFVQRRFDEVSKVLASKYGSESLTRLDGQVVQTADSIKNIKDKKQREEAADKYIAELSFISAGLKQQQKQILNTQSTQSYSNPTPTFYSPPSQSSQTPSQSTSSSISNQIDQTQNTIQSTINDLNKIQTDSTSTQPINTPTPTPTPSGRGGTLHQLNAPSQPTDTPIPTQEPPTPTQELSTPTQEPPTATPTPHNNGFGQGQGGGQDH